MSRLEHGLPIYLDYNATTPVDPRVAEQMLPFLQNHFGNPSSGHYFGQTTSRAITKARQQVASLLGVSTEGVIFTSGGSESNNQAILGAAEAAGNATGKKGRHIVTTSVEHPAINEVCQHLETRGFSTTYVPVDKSGMVAPAAVAAACTDNTIMISVMLANNEVGTIQPVAEIAAAARRRGIPVHSDCAQAIGKIEVNLNKLGVDMISVAGHKLYAPKGIGALCLRDGFVVPRLIHGANHETNRRAGTENVMGIVGLGVACELAEAEIAADISAGQPHLAVLRDKLEKSLTRIFPQARINGHNTARLPNTLSISFPGVDAGAILSAMPQIAASAGAACHGHKTVISHVLEAMSVPVEYARGTIRFSVGRMTTEQEIEDALPLIIEAVESVHNN